MFNGRNNNYRPLLRIANILKIKIHVLEFNGDRNQVFDFENQLPFEINILPKRILNFGTLQKLKKSILLINIKKFGLKIKLLYIKTNLSKSNPKIVTK